MTSPAVIYQSQMHSKIGFFATWLPGDHMELAGIGTLKDGRFRQVATLRDLDIEFKKSKEASPQSMKYTSTSGTELSVGAKAAVPGASTEVELEFSEEGSFLFDALNVRQIRIENRFHVANAILERYKEGKWKKEWYVVEALYLADSATIIVAQEKSAKLVFGAKTSEPVQSISLADPTINLSVKSTRGKTLQIIGARNVRPLFSCLRLRDEFFRAPKVVPVRGAGTREQVIDYFALPAIDELINS